MEQQTVGLCIRHPRFLDYLECHDLLGGPHVRFALAALKESAMCDRLFFYSANDEENRAAEALGYVVIPYRYDEAATAHEETRKHVYNAIAASYDMPESNLEPVFKLKEVVKCYLYADANMPLLSPETFRRLAEVSRTKALAFAAGEMGQQLMLPQKDGSFAPLLYDANQVFYQSKYRPRAGQFFFGTRAYNPAANKFGRLNYYYHMIPRLEQLYIDGSDMVALAEAYLEKEGGASWS